MNKNLKHICKENHLDFTIEYFLHQQFWTMNVSKYGDIVINNCPFCGDKLKEFSKKEIETIWKHL